jgi:hypothetical protein
MRPTRTVKQTRPRRPRVLARLKPAVPPPVRRCRRHVEGGRGRLQRHPTRDRRNERVAASQSELRVTVKRHPSPPSSRSLARPTASKEGRIERIEPQPFTTSVGRSARRSCGHVLDDQHGHLVDDVVANLDDSKRPSTAQRNHVAWSPGRNGSSYRRRIGRPVLHCDESEAESHPVSSPGAGRHTEDIAPTFESQIVDVSGFRVGGAASEGPTCPQSGSGLLVRFHALPRLVGRNGD